MSNQETALKVLELIESGSVDTALFTSGGQWWSNAGVYFPIADFNALLAQLHAATEKGIRVSPEAVLEQGNIVVIEATSLAALKSGKTYANRYAFVIRFEGSLIGEVREYSDTAHIFDTFDLKL